MRLIDADKYLEKVCTYKETGCGSCKLQTMCPKDAPTVKAIPLNKPFCKMVYGDYVCYNRNWLMKHLPMELDILRGKAIPIEWIKNVWLKNPDNQGEIDFFPPATFEVVMNWLIEDWEKENARD